MLRLHHSSTSWVANRVAFEVGILLVKHGNPEGPRHAVCHNAKLKLRKNHSSIKGTALCLQISGFGPGC